MPVRDILLFILFLITWVSWDLWTWRDLFDKMWDTLWSALWHSDPHRGRKHSDTSAELLDMTLVTEFFIHFTGHTRVYAALLLILILVLKAPQDFLHTLQIIVFCVTGIIECVIVNVTFLCEHLASLRGYNDIPTIVHLMLQVVICTHGLEWSLPVSVAVAGCLSAFWILFLNMQEEREMGSLM